MEKELTENSILWRVIDFDKFCDILIHNQLFFSAPSSFDDPWELYPPQSWLSQEFWVKQLKEKNKQVLEINVNEAARNIVLQIQGIYKRKDRFGISCWTTGAHEKEHLWRLYGMNNNSIAIKTTVKKLVDSFQDRPSKVFVGKVNYIDYQAEREHYYSLPIFSKQSYPYTIKRINVKNQILPFMYKRKDFSHESEVRGVICWNWDSAEVNRKVSISFDLLVDEILISPFADSWFEDVVKSLVRHNTNIPLGNIIKSTLYKEPEILEGTEDYLKKVALNTQVSKERSETPGLFAVFANIKEFNAWQESVSMAMGFPSFGYNGLTGGIAIESGMTLRWANPIKHPENERILAPATDLLVTEGIPLISKEEAKEQGWFRENEEI